MKRWLSIVALLAASAFVVVPWANASASTVESAYWWQGGLSAVLAPPSVPKGGLYVSSNVALGTTAVSAIRFRLGANEVPTQVVLSVSNVVEGTGVTVDAYPTTSQWKPGDSQNMAGAPMFDNSAPHAPGVLSPDRKTMIFDLQGITRQRSVSLVLVPGSPTTVAPTPVALPHPSFDITFNKVTAGNIKTLEVAQQPVITGPVVGPPVGAPTPTRVGSARPTATEQPSPAAGIVPTTAPPPAPVVAAPQAVTRTVLSGRSARDTFLLAFLLGDVLLWLGWTRWRAAKTSAGAASAGASSCSHPSIYDLPASANGGTSD